MRAVVCAAGENNTRARLIAPRRTELPLPDTMVVTTSAPKQRRVDWEEGEEEVFLFFSVLEKEKQSWQAVPSPPM